MADLSPTAVGTEELLLDGNSAVTPLQILRSTDLIYLTRHANLPFDVWRLGPDGSKPVAQVGGFYPRFSQDEQWLAFGRPEVTGDTWRQTLYVSSPPFGETRRAIAGAASTPRWRMDGRELFYLSEDSTIVAVPIDPPGRRAIRQGSCFEPPDWRRQV